jgi:hypothetical protein
MNTTKIDIKKDKRHLRVNLDNAELLAAGKSNADKTIELNTLNNDEKRIKDDFKAKKSALEAEIQSLSNKISTGYEYRNVTVTVFLADPAPDKKRIIRDDTGELVAIEDMTSADATPTRQPSRRMRLVTLICVTATVCVIIMCRSCERTAEIRAKSAQGVRR